MNSLERKQKCMRWRNRFVFCFGHIACPASKRLTIHWMQWKSQKSRNLSQFEHLLRMYELMFFVFMLFSTATAVVSLFLSLSWVSHLPYAFCIIVITIRPLNCFLVLKCAHLLYKACSLNTRTCARALLLSAIAVTY